MRRLMQTHTSGAMRMAADVDSMLAQIEQSLGLLRRRL
jgi:hypothetical protein